MAHDDFEDTLDLDDFEDTVLLDSDPDDPNNYPDDEDAEGVVDAGTLECPGCGAEIEYDAVGDADGGAGCPVCLEVFEPDDWFD